ncbi:MAG: low temperature requirement protein A [Planctomycetota bacterium]
MADTLKHRWLKPMQPRDPHEAGRAATMLELLFDLCFVVAIAIAGAELHHGIAEAHFGQSILGFAMVFFAIWWAWMGQTWFASAYDTDDSIYRIKVFVQMVGVLVLAAGVRAGMQHQDFRIMTLGFVIMRVGLIAQWLRAAKCDPPRRKASIRFAYGLALCQVGWVGLNFLGLPSHLHLTVWMALVLAELAVPAIASRSTDLPWHAHHIAERYGLLTIIVIGESVLAATLAVQKAVDAGSVSADLVPVIAGSPLIVFSMWWLYFLLPAPDILTSFRKSFVWGYGHAPIFMSAAAVGAMLALQADQAIGHTHINDVTAGMALAIPVAVYLLSVLMFQILPHRPKFGLIAAFIVASGLVIGVSWVAWPTLWIGLLMAGLTCIGVALRHK